MKKKAIMQWTIGLCLGVLGSVCLGLFPGLAHAEEASAEKFSREELAQMLAPIALYPDTLLSQVLMASTYPIEVVEADRWVVKNTHLRGDALDRALLEKDWDPSVKALCHFPSILALMSERIAETTRLGNAFLAQEDELMDMVQELRAEAYARGNLNSTSEQKVVVGREVIVIEPVDTRVVYVPYYDPITVYGSWWYPAYPPYYWVPPGVRLGLGLSFWPGVYFGFSFANWSYFDWHHHYVHIDSHHRPRYARHDRWRAEPGPWQHAPRHRRGVAYYDRGSAERYGQPLYRSSNFRQRGRTAPERQELGRDNVRRGDERPRGDRDRRLGSDATVDRTRPPAQSGLRQGQPLQKQPRLQQEQVRQSPVSVERQRTAVIGERQQPAVIHRDNPPLPPVGEKSRLQPMADRNSPPRQRLETSRPPQVRSDFVERQSGEVGHVNRQQVDPQERSGFFRGSAQRDGINRFGGHRDGGNRGGPGGGGNRGSHGSGGQPRR